MIKKPRTPKKFFFQFPRGTMLVVPPTLLNMGASLTPPPAVHLPDVTGLPLVDDPVNTGVTVYLVSLVALTLYDAWRRPASETWTAKERDVPWITPLTADLPIPPPTLKKLADMDGFRVGRREGVVQFIRVDDETRTASRVPGVREASPEWSRFYNSSIEIFKSKT